MTHLPTEGRTAPPLTAVQPAAVESADQVAAVVRGVPGVVGLHAGMFGEVGTYLPGRRVPGVRLSDTGADIHVSVFFDAAVREVAAQIRSAVHAVIGGAVNVTVEDVLPRPTLSPEPPRRFADTTRMPEGRLLHSPKPSLTSRVATVAPIAGRSPLSAAEPDDEPEH